jgi:hypothetical protein
MKTLAGAAIGGARATYRHTEANAPLRANATLEARRSAARRRLALPPTTAACTTGEVVHVDGGYHVLGMPQAENLLGKKIAQGKYPLMSWAISMNWVVLERAAGIEPASSAWKAEVLPLHNARAPFVGIPTGQVRQDSVQTALAASLTIDAHPSSPRTSAQIGKRNA